MGEVEEVSVDEIANLLEQFRLVKEKYDAIAVATGERFNVFEVLGVEWVEMKHSAMLSELLDPNGSHAQGAVFLRLFVEVLQLNCLSDVELDDFEVTTEASRGEFGRIDILIENSGSNKKCVVIENKIGAGGSWQQLGKYDGYARKICDNDEGKFVVVYLTIDEKAPDGYVPDYKELRKRVLRVSYGKHIIEWLDKCINAASLIAPIREILFQYRSLLKRLTHQPMHQRFIMDTHEIFSRPENCELIPALEQAIPVFKENLKHQLWEEMCNQFGTIFRVVPDDDYSLYVDLNTDNDTKIYSDCCMGNDGEVFYSFRVRDEKGDVVWKGYSNKKYNKYQNAADKIKLRTKGDWCLCWERFQNGAKFGKPDGPMMQKLVCENQRKKIAKQIVAEVKESQNSFLEWFNGVR